MHGNDRGSGERLPLIIHHPSVDTGSSGPLPEKQGPGKGKCHYRNK